MKVELTITCSLVFNKKSIGKPANCNNSLPVAPFLALALFDYIPEKTDENGIRNNIAIIYLPRLILELAFARGDIVTILETNNSGMDDNFIITTYCFQDGGKANTVETLAGFPTNLSVHLIFTRLKNKYQLI